MYKHGPCTGLSRIYTSISVFHVCPLDLILNLVLSPDRPYSCSLLEKQSLTRPIPHLISAYCPMDRTSNKHMPSHTPSWVKDTDKDPKELTKCKVTNLKHCKGICQTLCTWFNPPHNSCPVYLAPQGNILTWLLWRLGWMVAMRIDGGCYGNKVWLCTNTLWLCWYVVTWTCKLNLNNSWVTWKTFLLKALSSVKHLFAYSCYVFRLPFLSFHG